MLLAEKCKKHSWLTGVIKIYINIGTRISYVQVPAVLIMFIISLQLIDIN